MNPSPSSPGPASSAWLARTVVTGVCAIGAFVAGLVLGLVGLVGVGTLVVVALVALAAGPWRRAALPLAAVGAALTLGGLIATRSDGRIALSIGNRVEGIAPGQLRSGSFSFRQGYGSLSVDLRNADLQPGSTTDLHLRSDVGSVVVALDRNVCTSVNLRWRQLEVNPVAEELQNWTDSAGLPGPADVPASNSFLPNLFSAGHPDSLTGTGLSEARGDTMLLAIAGRFASGPANWFGQTQSRVLRPRTSADGSSEFSFDQRDGTEYRLTRKAADPKAAVVNLDIQAGSGFVVRDYPAGVAIAPSPYGDDGLDWPLEAQGSNAYIAPDEPTVTFGQIYNSGAARGQWSDWERAWVKAAKRRAVLAAGNCATRDALRDHWEWVGYAYDEGGTAGHALAVNGLGELVATSSTGAPPAAGSAERLARATGTTAISKATQQERLKTYRAANLPEEAR